MAVISEYRISFANKFYTLWHYEYEHIIDYDRKQEYDYTKATYIKNISFDKDVAFAKYPNLKFDDSLRGKSRSFDYYSNVKDIFEPHTFTFGKYKHMKFVDCDDINYMRWYFDSLRLDEITEDIQPLVDKVSKTYVLYKNNNWYYQFITKEEYESLMSYDRLNKDVVTSLSKNGWAIITIDSNWLDSTRDNSIFDDIDKDTYVYIDDYSNKPYAYIFCNTDANKFILPKELTRYYEGNYYSSGGHKAAINGVGKNLKNKDIKVYAEKIKKGVYVVKSFEIIK